MCGKMEIKDISCGKMEIKNMWKDGGKNISCGKMEIKDILCVERYVLWKDGNKKHFMNGKMEVKTFYLWKDGNK